MSLQLCSAMQSVEDFCGARGRAIRLPLYQRNFCWGEDEFLRFFQSIVEDISREDEAEPATFMGSIICFKDTRADSSKRSRDIREIIDLVDGQQRITTILLLLIIISEELDNELNSGGKWFRNRSQDLCDRIKKIIGIEENEPETPRTIRELEDAWPTKERDASYKSPIAISLFNFLNAPRQSVAQNPAPSSSREILESQKSKLKEAFREFYEQKSPEPNDLHCLGNIEDILAQRSRLFTQAFGFDVQRAQSADEFLLNDTTKKNLLAILFAGNYILKHVKFVEIDALDSYSRAMSIFDTLNTTGQPLNAFEAFKSNVVKHVGVERYPGSRHKEYIDSIEKSISKMPSTQGRKSDNSRVAELIVSFALGNCGTQVVQTNILEQNKYLRTRFNLHQKNEQEILGYIKFFRDTANMNVMFAAKGEQDEPRSFFQGNIDNLKIGNLRKELDEAGFCLRFLHKSKFTLPISILSIYLQEVPLENNVDNTAGAISAFCRAVKSTAAFFALWRAGDKSTNGVDGGVRRIMKGIKAGGNYKKHQMREHALARYNYTSNKKGRNNPIPTAKLSEIFVNHIVDKYPKVNGFEGWYEQIKDVPIYDAAPEVVRFLLLIGSHGTIIEDGPTMVTAKSGAVTSYLTSAGYDSALFNSLEHIRSIKDSDAQQNDDAEGNRNCLWNLTLVPKEKNSTLSNRGWLIKQAMYGYYSAKAPKEIEASEAKLRRLLNDDAKLNTFLKNNKDTGYLPMTEYLANLNESEFDKITGEKRIKAILDNAWKILAEQWLDWPN